MKLRISIIILACLLAIAPLSACGNTTQEDNFMLPESNLGPNGQPLPQVVFTMADGSRFAAELYPHVAPNTVNNFLHLVNEGFYDGLIFHRVIEGFMIQGGCPQRAGTGGPGYTIACETQGNTLPHAPGVLSMAHAGLNTGGSQFFIMHGNAPHLNGRHTGFGRIIAGMDVVNRIAGTQTVQPGVNDRPVVEQRIQSVVAHTHGVVYSAPVTGPAR